MDNPFGLGSILPRPLLARSEPWEIERSARDSARGVLVYIYIYTYNKPYTENTRTILKWYCVCFESMQLIFLELKFQFLSYRPSQTIALEV